MLKLHSRKMRKLNSIVALFGLLVLPALVVGSVLPPTAQQLNNHKLALSFEQPKANNNSDTDHKIVGGLTAGEGAFPYMVSLRRGNEHFCGGSIISSDWILTAAHCVYGTGPEGLTAVVGTNTLNQGGVAHSASRIISHQSYNPQTTINDIAVIRLAATIEFSSEIQPIALVSANPGVGSTTTLSGWGLTSYPGSIPNALQFINLQTLDLQSCETFLHNTNPITNGHLCTTSPPNYGGCLGDSGGPLVQYGEQVGIVSWGIPCAKGYPDVYTSVAFYRNWILSNTRIIL